MVTLTLFKDFQLVPFICFISVLDVYHLHVYYFVQGIIRCEPFRSFTESSGLSVYKRMMSVYAKVCM